MVSRKIDAGPSSGDVAPAEARAPHRAQWVTPMRATSPQRLQARLVSLNMYTPKSAFYQLETNRAESLRRRRRSRVRQLGPVNAMDTDALHGRKRSAQGAEAKAGWVPGEPSQRSDGRLRQQPEGNGRPGAPLFVALLAKTASLGFVGCRDWRPMPSVRVCAHSVNRP